jgi:hypothetical protein
LKIVKSEKQIVGHILLDLRPTQLKSSQWVQTEIDLQMSITPNKPNYGFKTIKGLPEPEAWTKQLATGIAEVLIGERPVFQLMRWVSFDVYREIDRQVQPKLELHAKRARPFVRCLRIENTSEKIIEATAVIQKGFRGRGMGLRLEAENDRWRCTQLLVA